MKTDVSNGVVCGWRSGRLERCSRLGSGLAADRRGRAGAPCNAPAAHMQ